MIRRPPRSTLFPTRRSSDLSARSSASRSGSPPTPRAPRRDSRRERRPLARPHRSEEHTSELQSRRDLVCRLLLEKKKKNKKRKTEKQIKKQLIHIASLNYLI